MNKIKELRETKKKTQIDMANDLEITSDYLSMIERGIRNPGFNLSKKIADYFDTTVDYIFFFYISNETFDKVDLLTKWYQQIEQVNRARKTLYVSWKRSEVVENIGEEI